MNFEKTLININNIFLNITKRLPKNITFENEIQKQEVIIKVSKYIDTFYNWDDDIYKMYLNILDDFLFFFHPYFYNNINEKYILYRECEFPEKIYKFDYKDVDDLLKTEKNPYNGKKLNESFIIQLKEFKRTLSIAKSIKSCDDIKNYIKKYKKEGLKYCKGSTNMEELSKSIYRYDNFDMNIGCLIMGLKRLALVDYDFIYDYGGKIDYYYSKPYDIIIRDYGKKYCNLKRVSSEIYYMNDSDEKYALLLKNLHDKNPPNMEIIRSLLLGYGENEIVHYIIYSDYGRDSIENYNKYINDKKFTDKYYKKIEIAKKWINKELNL